MVLVLIFSSRNICSGLKIDYTMFEICCHMDKFGGVCLVLVSDLPTTCGITNHRDNDAIWRDLCKRYMTPLGSDV